ncbi:MAG TPA: class I SAM-dependent methyltransferase [Gaiellaceae bacterium]|nr:class I SAM-dependent methyltransferase [Gaiellaceae bacterium]
MTPQAAIGSSSVELWDRVARLYDLQLWLERPALRVAVVLAGPRSDDSVLDIGTGTGALLRELVASGARPEKVVGVDASTRMLERARSAKLPGEWRLEQADARKLPFADESFSLVFASYVLNVLSDEDGTAVLREVHRVLAPGGRLVVVSPVAPSWWLARPYRRLAELLPRLLPWLCVGIRLLDPEPLIRASGLQPEERLYVSRGYPSVCVLAVRNAAKVRTS